MPAKTVLYTNRNIWADTLVSAYLEEMCLSRLSFFETHRYLFFVQSKTSTIKTLFKPYFLSGDTMTFKVFVKSVSILLICKILSS